MLSSLLRKLTRRAARPRSNHKRTGLLLEPLESREVPSVTVLASADTYLEAAYPDKTHGESTTLRAKLSPDQESLFRFNVSDLSGTVQSAKLRVYVYGGSKDGPAVFSTSAAWNENGVTWNTRPARLSGAFEDKGAIAVGWTEFDVTPAVTGNGTYSFALAGTSSSGLYMYSREKAGYVPQLVITTAAALPPAAPGALTAAAVSSSRVDVTWQDNSNDETGFTLERSGDGAVFASIGNLSANVTSYNDTAVAADTTYYYRVRAYSSAGNSTYSNVVSVVTPALPPPVVNAGLDQTANEGQAVYFAGTVSGGVGPISWIWNFGDGATANATLAPAHAFADNGTYTVRLIATDSLGRTVEDALVVTVNNVAPVADAGGPYAAVAGTAVTLEARASDAGPTDSAAGFTFTWNFGDGTTGTGASPTHTYTQAGTYSAVLSVRDKDGGATTAYATIDVAAPEPEPVANLVTDPYLVLDAPYAPKPAYLASNVDPTFGTTITRIADDPGTRFSTGNGTWGTDARHHYSKDQPWNADGTLIALENRGTGATPSRVFLDGETYQIKFPRPSNYPSGEERWHPSLEHANERIIVKDNKMVWFDVVRNVVTRSWALPIPVHGIGMGEGNPSADGRLIALVDDNNRMFVVDMNAPGQRYGAIYDLAQDNLGSSYAVSWVSVSPSGKYVVVHYSGDYLRVFDVDQETLALTPRAMSDASPRVRGTAAQGFIYDLGHADMALNPFDNNEDVIIGQEHGGNSGKQVPGISTMPGVGVGRVVMVRLSDGMATSLTDPTNEATAHHVSTRNVDRPGWAYVTYKSTYPGKRFNDEIVAVKMDGSGQVERLAFKRSNSSGNYRAESHAVPSRDGMRVIFASNWVYDGNGTSSVVQAYVIDTRPNRPSSTASFAAPEASSSSFTDVSMSTTETTAANSSSSTSSPAQPASSEDEVALTGNLSNEETGTTSLDAIDQVFKEFAA